MRPPLPRLRCSWPAATFAVVALADPTGATEDLPTILERAGAYVLRHAESFRYVVAEENYRQWYLGGTDAIRSRTLRSDLVCVRLPGPLPWTTFRDVFEVDGAKVRDRDRRLEKLFLRSSPRKAGEQAEE